MLFRSRGGRRTSDTGDAWVLQLQEQGRTLERAGGDADAVLEGAAADLLCFLWNRPVEATPHRSGDAGLWDTWADLVRIR